jgi:hypothetical protein
MSIRLQESGSAGARETARFLVQLAGFGDLVHDFPAAAWGFRVLARKVQGARSRGLGNWNGSSSNYLRPFAEKSTRTNKTLIVCNSHPSNRYITVFPLTINRVYRITVFALTINRIYRVFLLGIFRQKFFYVNSLRKPALIIQLH